MIPCRRGKGKGKCYAWVSNQRISLISRAREKLKPPLSKTVASWDLGYLTRLFQEHLNLGVSTYITYVRIGKAIDFKHQNPQSPLTDLALDMGFDSQQINKNDE